MKYNYVTSLDQIPEGVQHYAVLVFDSIFIPGDERSRTNPGHGYPGGTQTTISYLLFDSREAWVKYIEKHKDCVALEVYRPRVDRKVTVGVRILSETPPNISWGR